MTIIENDLVVEIDYSLTTSEGKFLDGSKEHGPLVYIQGKNSIIPGLEKELTGKKVGDTLKIVVNPEEAYGLRDEALVQLVKKEQFGENIKSVQVGMQFQIKDEEGNPVVLTAVEVREDNVVLDANHPLAGEPLHFDVEVLSLRAATAKEIETGLLEKESKCCDNKGCC